MYWEKTKRQFDRRWKHINYQNKLINRYNIINLITYNKLIRFNLIIIVINIR